LKLLYFIFITFLSLFGYAQQIDNQSSVVNFRIGNLRINTVSGTFTGMQGTVKFDTEDLVNSSFSVCIDAASVDTGNNRRDRHLREEEYFDVERFPDICYVSDIITQTDEGFITRGKLTIKGITRIVSIPFKKDGNTLRGTLSLNRLDYNVGDGVSTFLVSNPVELEIIYVIQP